MMVQIVDIHRFCASKFTLWEGGVPAFITGGYLPERRKDEILDKNSNDRSQ